MRLGFTVHTQPVKVPNPALLCYAFPYLLLFSCVQSVGAHPWRPCGTLIAPAVTVLRAKMECPIPADGVTWSVSLVEL